MFGINRSPKYMGDCTCEIMKYGNRPQVKSALSGGLTAAMLGWDTYCRVKDYDELAKEEAEKEVNNATE